MWLLWWNCVPTRLNRVLENDDCMLFEMYNIDIDMAMDTSFKMPFSQVHTPKRFFLGCAKIGAAGTNEHV